MMEPITGRAIVNQARTWIDTPWHHSACVKGVGVDCAMLLAGVVRELGMTVSVSPNYTRGYELPRMVETISNYCDRIADDEPMQAGDVIIFSTDAMPNHSAIYNGEGGIIHAYAGSVGRVVENNLEEHWIARIYGVYRLRGVTP